MLSQTTEYALRAVVYLGYRYDIPQTAREIADFTHVPVPYLSKVLQSLGRARLICSQRGLHGGFALSRAPETITLLDVVRAVEPLPRIRTCPLGLLRHGGCLCVLHQMLDDAVSRVERCLAEATIAAMIEGPCATKPLCTVSAELPREQRVALSRLLRQDRTWSVGGVSEAIDDVP